MALAAGLMIYVSLVGLRIEGEEYICCAVGEARYQEASVGLP